MLNFGNTTDITAYVTRARELGIADEAIQQVTGEWMLNGKQIRALDRRTLDREIGALLRTAIVEPEVAANDEPAGSYLAQRQYGTARVYRGMEGASHYVGADGKRSVQIWDNA